MADLRRTPDAEIRTTNALLRGTGGRAVLLRLPVPAIPGDATEQLGLATPLFQRVELAPVVLLGLTANGTRQLLVSATAVSALVGSLGFSAAGVLFAQAASVVLDDVPMEIVSVAEDETGGVPYLYRLTLRAPQASLAKRES